MTVSRVTVLIEYRALAGQADRAIAEIDRLIATVVKEEADCFGIRLLQDSNDPDRLLLSEEWTSREAYVGPHFQTPHLKDFIARASGFLAGPPSIQYWIEKSSHSPAVEPS